MKKIILMLLLFPIFVHSQTPDVTGVLGIDFGSTKETVISKMKLRGYSVKPDKNEYLTFDKIKFGAFDAYSMSFYFTGNKLFQALILMFPSSEGKTIEFYNDVVKELSTKYGQGESYKNFKEPYKDGDGYEITALKTGKANYKTYWVKNEKGTVSTYINEDLIIGVLYQDAMLINEAIKSQSSKNKNDY